ncbi:MAG: hypothetical protein HYV77_04395 [Candidatus Wildermuthbacteria bacterium]|nr:hypothetical protein [Candidatus Wildermuthbacteria bacterium]
MKRNALIGFAVLLALAGAGAKFAVEKFSEESSNKEQGQAVISPTPILNPTPVPTLEPTPVPTPTPEIISLETAVKALLAGVYGVPSAAVELNISKEADIHARGTFKYGPATPQIPPVFLTVKVNGSWQLAYDGRGIMSCKAVDTFKFPQSMVQDCRLVVKMGELFFVTVNKIEGIEWKLDFDANYIEFSGKTESESKKEEVYTFKGLKIGNTEITFSSLEQLMGQPMPLSREAVHEITIQ